jgi:3-oxoacyl-[acyl-carrier protein] reductase
MAPMRLMRVIAPRMAEAGGGRIVNVCSSSALRPSRTLDAAYSVTKAAELALSRAFADEFEASQVSVRALTPGPVATELWTSEGGLADQIAARNGKSRDEVVFATHRRSATGRMSTPEEVAAAIALLCAVPTSDVSDNSI